jgi:(E)-4-hydroxy-3-methylbut-2-enyl-diphosphate synthase
MSGSFPDAVLVFRAPEENAAPVLRNMFSLLARHGLLFPVIIRASYREKEEESLMIRASCELGPLFMDELPDGIWIDSPLNGGLTALRVSAGILQAARLRMFHTEYISCPSCGRTQFDIQATTRLIREATAHLTGLRIAVMGCIVNGPGEMADADYGYVGAGPGLVSLYHRKELVKKNIKETDALRELISLIREKGDWKENI